MRGGVVMNEQKTALDYQGDVLTPEGWDEMLKVLDFLPGDMAVREAFMKGFAVQAAIC